jgi:hypothetical protein
MPSTKSSKVVRRASDDEPLGKEVPLQVMVSEPIRKQLALLSVERGENLRTTVLRGLKAIGVRVPDRELVDRRGRRARGQ